MKTIIRGLTAAALVASFAAVASAASVVTPMEDEWVYNSNGQVAGSVEHVDTTGGAEVRIGTPFRTPTFVTEVPGDGFTLQNGHLTLR